MPVQSRVSVYENDISCSCACSALEKVHYEIVSHSGLRVNANVVGGFLVAGLVVIVQERSVHWMP